jgi:hypothetical protein
MGARNPDRTPRLHTLRSVPPGFVRMVRCQHCGHMAPLPLRELIRRHGELIAVEAALSSLRCEHCQTFGAVLMLARLCDPGCRAWRG